MLKNMNELLLKQDTFQIIETLKQHIKLAEVKSKTDKQRIKHVLGVMKYSVIDRYDLTVERMFLNNIVKLFSYDLVNNLTWEEFKEYSDLVIKMLKAI